MEDIEQLERPYRWKKGVEESNIVFSKLVGSYKRSTSYVLYGSCCARNNGVIGRNGDMHSERLADLKTVTLMLVGTW